MSNLHFQYFLLGRKHQLSSQSAALRARRGMVLPGFKTAKKGCSTFSEFSISVGEPPHSFFRNLESALSSSFLSFLPRYARPPTELDIFQKIISAMLAGTAAAAAAAIALWKIRNSWKTRERRERERARGGESVEKIGRLRLPIYFSEPPLWRRRYRDEACFFSYLLRRHRPLESDAERDRD